MTNRFNIFPLLLLLLAAALPATFAAPVTTRAATAAGKLSLTPAMVTNESGKGDAAAMVDEQTLAGDPLAGTKGAPVSQWSPGFQTGTYPVSAYIDLGAVYNLSNVFIYDTNGINDLIVSTGEPGNWTPLFTDTMSLYKTWVGHPVSAATRYVRVTMTGSGANFGELVLYGALPDTTPPAAVADLAAGAVTSTTVQVGWTATGDDGTSGGPAASHELRYSKQPLTEASWASAAVVGGPPPTREPGTAVSALIGKLTPSTTYYFAVKSKDAAGNVSPLSNVASSTTAATDKIVLNPDMVSGAADDGNFAAIADEQTIAGDPLHAAGGMPLSGWDREKQAGNDPAYATIDLGQSYVVSNVYYYDSKGVGKLEVDTGSAGSWTPLFTDVTNHTGVWTGHEVQATTRYIGVAKLKKGTSIGEIVLYGTPVSRDATPPADVTDFASPGATNTSVTLTWTAPGDDAFTGTATAYDIRISPSPIDDASFAAATPLTGVPAPAPGGMAQSMTVDGLAPGNTYYFAMKAVDAAGNRSGLSNVLKRGTSLYACSKTIPNVPGTVVYYGGAGAGAQYLDAQPGDVVCIAAGTRQQLKLIGFVGTQEHPITIVNYGGEVVVQNDPNAAQGYAFAVSESKYFRLTGTGDPNFVYGLRLSGKHVNNSALSVGDLSTNYELDHIEVFDMNAGFAGFLLKTDPKCDLSTNRDVFTQYDTNIHDNYIHDTGGEGMYIGYSFFNGHASTCKMADGSSQSVVLYPHTIEGLQVHDNIVKHTGWDGIQIGSATKDVDVYRNSITDFGYKNEFGQDGGLQINPGTTGKYHHNWIGDGPGTGIDLFGRGDIDIYDNVVFNVTDDGIYSDDRRDNASDPIYQDHSGIRIMNNTFIQPGLNGIEFNNLALSGNTFVNNIVTMAQENADHQFVKVKDGVSWSASNNLLTTDPASISFADFAHGDYRLLPGSPAIDAGTDVAAAGVGDDYDGHARPAGAAYDIGAFEHTP